MSSCSLHLLMCFCTHLRTADLLTFCSTNVLLFMFGGGLCIQHMRLQKLVLRLKHCCTQGWRKPLEMPDLPRWASYASCLTSDSFSTNLQHARACIEGGECCAAGSTLPCSQSAVTLRTSWHGPGHSRSCRPARTCGSPLYPQVTLGGCCQACLLETYDCWLLPWAVPAELAGARGEQGEETLQACRNGKNWTLLFGVILSSTSWLIWASIVMHAISSGCQFAFPLLLKEVTEYLSTCDVRRPSWLALSSLLGAAWHGIACQKPVCC